MSKKATWKLINSRLRHAERLGEEYASATHESKLPIDPFAIAKSEAPLLQFTADDFRDAFDGQLEYHRKHNRFLLFVNTKYDVSLPPGAHHSRTRFSMSHELAHYYLEAHRAYLMRGGQPHGSASEFQSDTIVEREADAFAAGLLMPRRLFSPKINAQEPSFDVIRQVADDFETSVLSTAIRMVRLSHFPCGIACVQDLCLAWMFCSDAMIEAGCYPRERGRPVKANAARAWSDFQGGVLELPTSEGVVGEWFRTFDNSERERIYLSESYFPIPIMNRLLVLLVVDEEDLASEDD